MRCILLLLAALLQGCSISEDFEYSSHKGLITVNGLLNPDSSFSLWVLRSAPYPTGKDFSSIPDARVELYENNRSLGSLVYDAAGECYRLDYYPKETHTYAIKVVVTE